MALVAREEEQDWQLVCPPLIIDCGLWITKLQDTAHSTVLHPTILHGSQPKSGELEPELDRAS